MLRRKPVGGFPTELVAVAALGVRRRTAVAAGSTLRNPSAHARRLPVHVFLSHSAKDKIVVRDIAGRLKKDGVKVWFDEWVLKPGDSIPAKIEKGLERSRVLVLCMSAHAFGSDWAQLESGTFRFRDPLNKERRFLPLRLDDAPIKGSLAQFCYLTSPPDRVLGDEVSATPPPITHCKKAIPMTILETK